MNILALNKRCDKLKDWCFKTPDFSYCNRYLSLENHSISMGKIRFTFISIVLLCIATKLLAGGSELDVLSYKVTIEPDIQNKYVQGSVVIKFQLPLNTSLLVLNSGKLQIDSISTKSVHKFTKNGNKLTVELTKKRELIAEITIHYHGNPTRGLLFDQENDQAYTVYFTNDWMVCNDTPSDNAIIDLSILVPKTKDCIANGQLISKEEKSGKVLYQWSQDFESPPYTYGFAIGNFQKFEMTYNEVKINNYAQNITPGELKQIFTETSNMISFFEEKSGIKYTQTSYSQILIGDYYQEMSGFSVLKDTYGGMVLRDSTETNLISHELAHQWWGNRITCKNWNHFWLNEALATYLSAAYNEYRFGKEKYNADINSYFKVYQDIKHRKADKPLVFKDWSNPTRDDRNIVYFKGAYVLHLLRQEIGEKNFWEGLRYYSQKNFDKLVTTLDFQHAFEEIAERDLANFFNKWVY